MQCMQQQSQLSSLKLNVCICVLLITGESSAEVPIKLVTPCTLQGQPQLGRGQRDVRIW